LGKRIVTELGLDQSTDTLSRWMAHRVAELMERAERARTKAARDSAARECEPLILRLWERRTSWPQGWPPPSAAGALERLASAEEEPNEFGFYRPRIVDDDDRTWLGTLPLIADLQRMELDAWRDAGLIELDVAEINDWLNEQGGNLSDEERATFERLVTGADRARRLEQQRRHRRLASPNDDQDGPMDVSLFAARIDDLAERRAEILRRVSPPKRKERSGPRRRHAKANPEEQDI
jgi:hypothetical protein